MSLSPARAARVVSTSESAVTLAPFVCDTQTVWSTCVVFLGISQKLISITLACLPHIAKCQAVTCQCHDGDASFSTQVRSTQPKKSLYLVWQPYSLLVQLSYVALYPKCVVMEPLTLLFARPMESVLQGIEKFRFMLTLESFRQCIQDHVHSIGSGHILWFQSQASHAGPVNLLKTRGPCNWAGVRVNRSHSFTFLR